MFWTFEKDEVGLIPNYSKDDHTFEPSHKLFPLDY